jgi:hypothetical protein
VPRYGLVDREYGLRLRSATFDGDGRIYMLSLTRYLPGQDLRPQPDNLGDSRWGTDDAALVSLLTAVGASLCFVGDVVASSGGWDLVTVVEYPTRQAFLELAQRRDFREWHMRKQEAIERTTVLTLLPAEEPPAGAACGRILLELWQGPAPDPLATGAATRFEVEGTIIGDGRVWGGSRYTVIEPGTALPLRPPRSEYQALLLEPQLVQWR